MKFHIPKSRVSHFCTSHVVLVYPRFSFLRIIRMIEKKASNDLFSSVYFPLIYVTPPLYWKLLTNTSIH